MIDITKFCAVSDVRSYLTKPWRCAEGVAASNGHILVLVPDDGGDYAAEPESMAGKIAQFETDYPGGAEWLDAASLAIPEGKKCWDCGGSGHVYERECDECDGDGEFEHGSHTYECKECDGSGSITSKRAFADAEKQACYRCNGTGHEFLAAPIGNTFAQSRYITLLATLPNCRVAPDGNKAMPFVFDGGRGWLMPCRG
jgi:hypothetical protein